MFKINMEKATKIGNEEVKELCFNFEDLTGEDVIAAEKACRVENPRVVVPELDAVFLTHLAARAAKVPEVVIRDLPMKKFIKVKNAVTVSLKASGDTEEAEEN